MSGAESSSVVVCSAPGKLILFGEHAVVVGERAIATCISLRTTCSVSRVQDGQAVVRLQLRSLGDARAEWPVSVLRELLPEKCSAEQTEQLERVVRSAVLSEQCASSPETVKALMAFVLLFVHSQLAHQPQLTEQCASLDCLVTSTLPVGAGLGSSAAYCASVCGALWRASRRALCSDSACLSASCAQPCKTCKDALNARTYQAERVLHGNPSGIDNSVAVYGGALSFTKKDGVHVLGDMPLLPLLLTDTRVPRSTQKLVSGVLARRDEFPPVMNHALAAIGELSVRAIELFAQAPKLERQAVLRTIASMIDMNQGLLECIGVSHSSIRSVINCAAEFGFHTKLTGAGGGGCVFTLLNDDTSEETKAKISSTLEQQFGMRCFQVNVGGPGLLFEEK